MALASLAAALAFTFLPLAITEIRSRQRAKPIHIVESRGASADSLGDQRCRPPADTAAVDSADARVACGAPPSQR